MKVMIRLSGEIGIKSYKTRKRFELKLINNIKKTMNINDIKRYYGYIIIDTDDNINKLDKIFGISSYSIVEEYDFKTKEDIINIVKERYKEKVKGKKFAIRVKRVGNHDFKSIDIARLAGDALYEYSNGVDLENPDIEIYIDIRQNKFYLYDNIFKGPKGLPVGTTGKTISLFSGGFDSPIATWMMIKRGVIPILLNFSFNNNIQKELVIKEAKVLYEWMSGNDLLLYIIDGVRILEKLRDINKLLRVVMLKRIMYKSAEYLADKLGAYSITTGESLSQVSSQTMRNLYSSSYGIRYPIFRPLIGFDKEEIISLSRRLGFYDLSSKMPEYCAISQKSTTKSKLESVLQYENNLNIDYNDLIENAEVLEINKL